MSEQTLTMDRGPIYGPAAHRGDYRPVIGWLVVSAMVTLGVALLWQLGLVQQVLATDHTYMSVLIAVIFVLTSIHCLVQCYSISREEILARDIGQQLRSSPAPAIAATADHVEVDGTALPGSILARHIANLARKAQLQGGGAVDQSLLLRDLSDDLHQRERLGLFVSEALLRLALLGTAIGFILMLIPISGITGFESDVLREALSGMTSGMAIALNVTVLGISTALILKLQYFFLDQSIARLFSTIIKVTEINVLPVLQKAHDAAR